MNSEAARMLRPDEVAELLGISVWTVRAWIEARKIPARWFGPRIVRVHPDWVKRVMETPNTKPAGRRNTLRKIGTGGEDRRPPGEGEIIPSGDSENAVSAGRTRTPESAAEG